MTGLKFEEAFKRPFLDAKKLIIGIVLSILPIINFFAIGYILRNAKLAFGKKFGLAEWDNWGDLFVKGLMSFIISLIYFIPALIVMFAGYSMSGTMFLTTGGISMLPTLGFMFVLFAVFVVFAAYVSPMAILNYINRDNFGDAFDVPTLKKTFSGVYFIAWIVGVIYMAVLGAILGMVPYIGSAIALYVTGMTSYTLLGNAFGMLKGKRVAVRKAKKSAKRRKTRRKR